MYPRRFLITLGLAAFIGSLVVFAPARLLLGLLPPDSPLRAAQVSGRLLDGQLKTASAQPLVLRWQWQPGWLLTLGMGGRWQAEHPDFQGNGSFILRPWHYALTVERGSLAPARMARLFGADAGVVLDQALGLQDVRVGGYVGRSINNAKGSLSWGPGTVTVRNRAQPVQVPALLGKLTTDDGVVQLDVEGVAAEGKTLATASVDLASRELHVVVLARAAEVLGLAVEHRQAPDAAFFELRQPLR